MATIDTGTLSRGAPVPEQRPVTPKPEVSLPPKPDIAMQEIAAKSASSKDRALTEMDKVQARLEEAISMLNERMRESNKDLSFSVDEASKRFVVSVKDQQTGEVIRQIPGESVLRVAHNIEALKGVLFEKDL